MRKHFGLLMLFSASVHACSYLLTYESWRAQASIPIWQKEENGTELVSCGLVLILMLY